MSMTDEQAHFRKECVSRTAQQLTRLYEFEAMMILGYDADERVTHCSVGLEAADMISMLEHVAESLRERHGIPKPRKRTLPEGLDISTYALAGRCPACNTEVHGPPTMPPEGIENCAAVCDCGSFLVPQYDAAGSLCGCALMTLEQVGALPDGVRTTLTRLRREGYSTGRKVTE